MNDETYTPCTKCGRPMAYCKGQCCGQPQGCSCQEYGPMKAGCLREIEPSCPYQAVIPTLTVEDKSNLKDLADCFVHVSNINTTFYIDDKHRTIVAWAGPVEYDNYDLDANSLGLRSQFLIDHANDYAAYYDKTGAYQKFNFNESATEGDVYTINVADGATGTTFTPFEYRFSDQITETYYLATTYYYNSDPDFTVTNSDGDTLSMSSLFALKDSLLASKFKFTTTIQYSGESTPEEFSVEAVPSNIVTSGALGDASFIISGSFGIEESLLTEHPGVVRLAPLRWSLYIDTSAGEYAEFTVEKVTGDPIN